MSTEAQIQYLIDRQRIRDTLLGHAITFDNGDLALLDDVWTEDCRRDDGDGRGPFVENREQLREKLTAAVAKFRWTHHHLGDSLIAIDGDTATAMTFIACWHEMLDGERCWGTSRYHDELRREADGTWRISYRRLEMTGAEGAILEHGGTWLDRNLPDTVGS